MLLGSQTWTWYDLQSFENVFGRIYITHNKLGSAFRKYVKVSFDITNDEWEEI